VPDSNEEVMMNKPVIDGPTSTSDPTRGPGTATGRSSPTYAWWLVLCLVGLDYFSTLAYLPSMAVEKSGRDFAVLTAFLLSAITMFVALPIYLYIAGRSPNGLGVTGLLESHFRGWGGKLLILFLLGFVAADFVITRTLSTADASLHLLHNSYWKAHVDWMLNVRESLRSSLPARLQGPMTDQVLDWWNEQVTVTVIMTIVGFALYFYFVRGFTRRFMIVAGVIASLFVLVNGVVIVSSLLYLANHPEYVQNWTAFQRVVSDDEPISLVFSLLMFNALPHFPVLALGLGGFELSLASIGLVRGRPDDDPARPRGRIRNARKLLVAAAVLMGLTVFSSVLSVTLLVPTGELRGSGPAKNRALAYLAHGGYLEPPGHDPNAPRGERPEDVEDAMEPPPQQAEAANPEEAPAKPERTGPTAADINPLFGPAFGTLYDISAILILFLAGASVTISLRDLLPVYLARYGMEMHWARRTGLLLHLFNLLILVVILYFHAHVSDQQGAYSTSVLVLLASAALAALVDMRARWRRSLFLPFLTAPLAVVFLFFLLMAGLAVSHSPAGAIIAVLIVAIVFVSAGISRWARCTELRFEGFCFTDEESHARWEEIRQLEFQVLVPHRPGGETLAEKDATIRARHRLGPDVPIIFVEARLGDPSDFQNCPLMQIVKEDGMEVIRVSHCASIAHVLAAIALEFSEVGRPPEIHFDWSNESPLASNLHFLLMGEGNVPWMVHALIRKAEPDPRRQPRVIIG
jgi:hypothetical protein